MSVYAKNGLLVRLLYLIVSCIWYLMTLGGWMNRRRAVVLCYHGITAGQRERFRLQMAQIAHRTVAVCRLNPSLFQGLMLPCVCVTFDDAFENLIDNALPILREYKIAAVVFVVPGNLGQKPHWRMSLGHPEMEEAIMTADCIRQISADNVSIGSHTQNHPDLAELPGDEIRKELLQSKETLEQLLHKPVVDLALPHGSYNSKVLDIAQQTGYQRIFTLDPCLFEASVNQVLIGRFSISPDVWPLEYFLTSTGAYQWLSPWRMMIRRLRKWLKPTT